MSCLSISSQEDRLHLYITEVSSFGEICVWMYKSVGMSGGVGLVLFQAWRSERTTRIMD